LLEYLIGERNLARNTQQSYRDMLCQLLPFIAELAKRRIDQLKIEDLSADRIRSFLANLEENRRCGPATRNQRLAAIRSLASFIGRHGPEHLQWCGEIRSIRCKKTARPLVTYLEKDEMDALLAEPRQSSAQGRRDHAVLLFLYNTGARADETAHLLIADLELGKTVGRDPSSVQLRGKGNKQRRCPLWEKTAHELLFLIGKRASGEHVFLNRRGQPLTRFGIHALVERYAEAVAKTRPSMSKKQLSPHTIRHTTATHLLRAGVDINTIRAWLGHVSITTTNVYAEVDLEMKAKALANCEVEGAKPNQPWRDQKGLIEFLRSL
jgi:site-specific recombinase XerD